MKRNKLIAASMVFAILLLVPAVSAQESLRGIKGGVNFSWLSVEDADDNNVIPGFHVGVYSKLAITEQFGIQPELLFSTKGFKSVYDADFLGFNVSEGETKVTLSYIDIPLYFTFNLSEDFDFHLGPYLGILLNANSDTDADILGFINIDNNEDIDRDEFNMLDYGLAGGLAFYIQPLTLGFNYSMGLRQVAHEDEAMEVLLSDAKNHVIQVFIGFAF
jgi:hypothetical protein